MTNFVYDNTALPAAKQDRPGFPVTVPNQQWAADDANAVFTALEDVRTVLGDQHANVRSFGAVGDGVVDDTAAIQDAIDATAGQPLYFPSGKYKVTSTLFISTRSHRLVGDFPIRSDHSGTEIAYSGVGPCIQIGTDSGNPWTSNEYDGPQDQIFEGLWFRHTAPDTALSATGVAGSQYKAGAYGIWDWRSGGIRVHDCGFERFEASFVGIQSDINDFDRVESHFSKFGIYIGPRSDQFSLHRLYSFFCERSVTIDGASNTRIVEAQLVGDGTETAAAIEVRMGSSAVIIDRAWLEHLQGYQGTDQLSFVSAGEVSGYGAGGGLASPGGTPNTIPVEVLAINDPFCFSVNAGIATHTRYIASVGKCHRLYISRPSTKVGNSLTNFDALVGVQAANAPTNAETQIAIIGASSGMSGADLFQNLGAGSPNLSFDLDGASGKISHSSTRWHFVRSGAAAGADEFRLSQEGQSGEFWVICPNHTGGQTERLRLGRHMGRISAAAAPTTGTYQQGDWKRIDDPTAAGYLAWVCTVGGTPGTWQKAGLVTSAVGFAVPDTFVAQRSTRRSGELVPAQLTGSVNDYNPTGFVDAAILILTSSAPFNITGLVGATDGRDLDVYNNNPVDNITLKHQDAASVAANRIIGRGNADVVLAPATSASLYYSPSLDRWIVRGVAL